MTLLQNEETQTPVARKDKKGKTVFLGFFKTFTAAVIGSVVTLTVVPHIDYFNEQGTAVESENTGGTETAQQQETSSHVQQVSSENSLADVIEQASKAVVGISVYSPQNHSFGQPFGGMPGSRQEIAKGTGSGVIFEVSKNDAYIVTNHHVIENGSTIKVTLADGEELEAELIGSDALTDIAVLKISGSLDLTPIPFGDSSALRVGDPVIAIGNPLGLNLSNTVTQGIVSGINRSVEVSTSSGILTMNVIQTDAAINPGNSGGALINTSGELVGINSMKISAEDVEGLGFAIPANDVAKIIKELKKNGQIVRPYLGISMLNAADLPPYYSQNVPNKVTEGVYIADIDKNGPAAKAGLQAGDIIISINKKKISNAGELKNYLYSETSIGDVITVQYYRDGVLKESKVTLTGNKNI